MQLNTFMKPHITRDYIIELLKYTNQLDLMEQFKNWEVPKFCITGKTLSDNGLPVNQLYGDVLKRLKEYWADRDFDVPEEELVKLIPDMYSLALKEIQPKKRT